MIGPFYVGDKPLDSVDVTILRDDDPVILSGYTSASITLEDPNGAQVNTSGTVVTIPNANGSVVTVTWPTSVSLFATAGVYSMQVLLNTASTTDHASVVTFEVRAVPDLAVKTWASLSDVMAFTGMEVTPNILTQAQGLIEMFASITYDDVADATFVFLSDRDKRQLKMAVAYQAAFVAQNEAIYSRAGVLSLSQDGVSVVTSQRSGGGVDDTALTVAPLAKMALSMLSWKAATKTARVRRHRDGQFPYLEDYANAWLRDETGNDGWLPIRGAWQ